MLEKSINDGFINTSVKEVELEPEATASITYCHYEMVEFAAKHRVSVRLKFNGKMYRIAKHRLLSMVEEIPEVPNA